MGADKVNAIIWDEIQVTCIALVDVYLAVGTLMLKVHLFLATGKGNIIDIHADNIAIEQLRFHQSRTTTGKLVKNKVTRLGIPKQNISRNIRRPVPAPFGIMSCPIASLWK